MESFVDLVYRAGACGEIVTEYLRHKVTGEAQLFGHGTLFLAEFLAEDALAQRARLRQLLAVPVPAAVRDFPRGRRTFAEIMTAWYDAPNQPLPPRLLACLRREAAPTFRYGACSGRWRTIRSRWSLPCRAMPSASARPCCSIATWSSRKRERGS